MTTVAVVGAGEIGGATAHALASSDSVSRVLLVDQAAAVAAGKALDIQQAGAIAGFHTTLQGTDDITRVIGCDVCIVADRFATPMQEWAGDDGLTMLTRLVPILSRAPIVFAGSSQSALIDTAGRELKIARERMVGSAPEAFASAVRAIVALEAGCSPSEVNLSVLGRPPDGLVIPWTDASIGGYSLEHRLEPVQLTRLDAKAERLWPPGPYALGLAAAHVALAMLESARRSYAVSIGFRGEFGVKDRVGVVPVRLSPEGVASIWTPILTSRESVRLLSALESATLDTGTL